MNRDHFAVFKTAYKVRMLNWFAISVYHVLSELPTMTCLSPVARHSMAHNFIELDKVLIPVISSVSFL